MKSIFALYSFLMLTNVFGQYSFSVRSMKEIDIETNEILSTNEVHQFFNFSLKDGFMVHNLVDDAGNIEDSQFYKIIKIEEKNNLFYLSCESGVSGKIYQYFINDDEVEGTHLFQYIEGSGVYQMDGFSGRCKSFNQ